MKKLISKWLIAVLLLNPFLSAFAASGINLNTQSFGTAPERISTLSVTMAANAVTISAPSPASSVNGTQQYLDFRSSDLTSGAASSVLAAPANLTIPSSATLGTTNAVLSKIAILEILPSTGSPELAVVNTSGGRALDEDELISTSGISAGSTLSTTVYSNTARTNVPYRVLGWFESTQATAGTWASQPSTVQGCGGNACADMTSIGSGQTWQNLTGSRSAGVTYYNTTGKPIMVAISGVNTTGQTLAVNGISVMFGSGGQPGGIIIPVGAFYAYSGGTITNWAELK